MWSERTGRSPGSGPRADMMDDARFDYLDLDPDGPLLQASNLERLPDGSLTLTRVPLLVDILRNDGAATTAAGVGAAGLAVVDDCSGNVFVSDPAGHRVWLFDACAGTVCPVLGLAGPGAWPG